MIAGDLRKRITFQSRIDTVDQSNGAVSTAWNAGFTCWGSIVPATAQEMIAAQSVQSGVTHTITVRYRREFADPITTSKMRAVYGTRAFNLKPSINEDERKRMITIQAEEGLSIR